MRFDTHFRMTLSRGSKASSSMNPMFNIFGCVLLIVPEWKPVRCCTTHMLYLPMDLLDCLQMFLSQNYYLLNTMCIFTLCIQGGQRSHLQQ